MIRIIADSSLCSGQGMCYSRAPELLDCDDEGFVTIRDKALAVPSELESLARDVALNCPEGALRIIEGD